MYSSEVDSSNGDLRRSSSDEDADVEKKHSERKLRKEKRHSKKSRKRNDSSSSDSCTSSDSESHHKGKRKLKKEHRKRKLKKERKEKKEHKKQLKEFWSRDKITESEPSSGESKTIKKPCSDTTDSSLPISSKPHDAVKRRLMKPMTKEEWDKQQSIIRRVTDPETGRQRLIKGDGEILEEIVPKYVHDKINKNATAADGKFFENTLFKRQ